MPDLITSHTDTVTPQLEQFRAELGAHYEEAHFILACHAAFPAFITPDLLYQLWANFKSWPNRQGRIHIMPALTVSDVLLSSLFRITGPDLYEMKPEVSAALVRQLSSDPRFGPDRIKALASFLYQYALAQPNKPGLQQFREAQQWTALMALSPALATEKLLKALMEKAGSQQVNQSLGIMNLMEGFVHNTEGFSEELSARLQPTTDDVPRMATIESIPGIGVPDVEGAILVDTDQDIRNKVELPAYVSTRLEGMRKEKEAPLQQEATSADTPESSNRQIRALIIGISDYPNMALKSPVSDARRIAESLQAFQQDHVMIQFCLDREATLSNVSVLIRDLLLSSGEDDTLLIYFSGHSRNHIDGENSLIMWDYNTDIKAPAFQGILYIEDFRNMIREYNRSNAHVILLLDCDSGHPEWLPPNDKNVMICAGHLGEKTYEDLEGSKFTNAVIKALSTPKHILSYGYLFHKIMNEFIPVDNKGEIQTPMFVYPQKIEHRLFLSNEMLNTAQEVNELLLQTGYEPKQEKQFLKDHILDENADILHFLRFKRNLRDLGTRLYISIFVEFEPDPTFIRFLRDTFADCGSTDIHPLHSFARKKGRIEPNMQLALSHTHVIIIDTRAIGNVYPLKSLLYSKISTRTYALDKLLITLQFPEPPKFDGETKEKTFQWLQVWGPPLHTDMTDSHISDFTAASNIDLKKIKQQLLTFQHHRSILPLPPTDPIQPQEPEASPSLLNKFIKSVRNIFTSNPKSEQPPSKLSGDADDDPDDDDDDDEDTNIKQPIPERPVMK